MFLFQTIRSWEKVILKVNEEKLRTSLSAKNALTKQRRRQKPQRLKKLKAKVPKPALLSFIDYDR